MRDNLHFHGGTSCRGSSTLKECLDEARRYHDVGKVLEQERDDGSKCYSMIVGKFDHWAQHGRFVAELRCRLEVVLL